MKWFPWFVVRVSGGSMAPALHDGDLVLARRYRGRPLRVGDIVVLHRPTGPVRLPPGVEIQAGPVAPQRPGWLVKRVAELVEPGAMVVLGDTPGYDSRLFGPVPVSATIGVVVRRRPARPSRTPPGRAP
ncbi:S26 family signal peptidase [Dactylosporangium sp. NPDC049140]|uniref:S26 family signal peptidase n=1 Tax=Dactylosporangium sp. NPDC049140 TaxID=3155647 RepID=UPI0033E11FEE